MITLNDGSIEAETCLIWDSRLGRDPSGLASDSMSIKETTMLHQRK